MCHHFSKIGYELNLEHAYPHPSKTINKIKIMLSIIPILKSFILQRNNKYM